MASDLARDLTLWRILGLVLTSIVTIVFDIKFEYFDHGHYEVLVDKLLGKLDLEFELSHIFRVLHEEVL